MTAIRVLFAGLFAATFGLLSVSAEQADGKIAQRKPIPAEVRKAAEDYGDTILKAVKILHKSHIKKVSREQLVRWAIRGLYQRMDDCEPSDIANRLRTLRDPSEEDLHDLLVDARQRLGNNAKLSELRDMDYSLEGIFARLEPDVQLTPLGAEKWHMEYYADWRGIGVEVVKDENSGFIRIVTPMKDGPAYKAGLRAGDIITRITQEEEERRHISAWSVSTKGLTVEQAKERLCGHAGSKIKLAMYREDATKPKELLVVRGRAVKERVLGRRRKADDSWDFLGDEHSKIAYARITGFTGSTATELTHILAEPERRSIKGLILDLRGNPGGLFTETMDCLGLFLEKTRVLVTIRMRSRKEESIHNESPGRFRGMPLVCLINSGTAGCSEVFAACLQDHHRALIVGERSCGKTNVQHIYPLGEGDLRFTTAVFDRPSGKPLSKFVTSGKEADDWGVRPNEGFVVKLTPRERKELAEHLRRLEIIAPHNRPLVSNKPFRDRQLDKAVEYLRKQARQAKS